MDKKVIENVRLYTEIIRKFYDIKKVVIYGSYAKGTENQYSDIDVAVIVDEYHGNYLEVSADLFNLTRKIDSRIEPVLISTKNDESGFLESILKYGKVIYQAS